MEKKNKEKKDYLTSMVNNFFIWNEKKAEKKMLKRQKREEKFIKFRIIKDPKIRAIIHLIMYAIFFIIMYIILK